MVALTIILYALCMLSAFAYIRANDDKNEISSLKRFGFVVFSPFIMLWAFAVAIVDIIKDVLYGK